MFGSFAPRYREKLEEIRSEAEGFYAWGAVTGVRNVPTWEAMERGDYVLCVYEGAYRYIARVLAKHQSQQFAEGVWGTTSEGETWQHIYFLTKPVEVGRPLAELADYLYIRYQGFTKLPDPRLDAVLSDYGSVGDFMREAFYIPAGVFPQVGADDRKPPLISEQPAAAGGFESGPDPSPRRGVVRLRHALETPGQLEPTAMPGDYPLPLVHAYSLVAVLFAPLRDDFLKSMLQ